MATLVKARSWIRNTFAAGSRPPLTEVTRWIQTGEVPGQILGGIPYVDVDQFAVQSPQPPPRPTGIQLLQ